MFGKTSRFSLIFFLIATVVVAVDQITKFLVESFIPYKGSWPSSGFFCITHYHNTGAAFSILQNSRILLSIISVVGALVVLYVTLFFSRRYVFLRWKSSMLALGLMLGGTIGNGVDRVFIGYVTDFISVGRFPDFNVADSALVVGCILLALNLFRASKVEQFGESTNTADI